MCTLADYSPPAKASFCQINGQPLEKTPTAILFSLDGDMVRVTPLAFASTALLALTAIEAVIAKSQQHFRDSSRFLDTCSQIATSISNVAVVYYPREPSIMLLCSGSTGFTHTAQPRRSITQTMRTGPNRARRNPHAALSQLPLRTSL